MEKLVHEPYRGKLVVAETDRQVIPLFSRYYPTLASIMIERTGDVCKHVPVERKIIETKKQ